MFYIKRVFILVVVFFECNYCHNILAWCRVKEINKPTEEAVKNNNPIALFASNYNTRGSVFGYIHDIYFRNKGFFYKFFLQQHTTSRTYYLCWTAFEHVLKKFIGVVWVYKTWKDFEFYYGSVIGMGWYPQSLNFNKYFRIGFFDMSINLIALFMHFCHLFCHLYFGDFEKSLYYVFKHFILQKGGKLNWGIFVAECENAIKTPHLIGTKKALDYYIKEVRYISAASLLCTLLCAFSFINIKTAFGIKIKFMRSIQIAKFIKFVSCAYCSNISILAYRICQDQENKKVLIDYHPENIFIYSYRCESHFFFAERDSIFLLLLELFIPSIEICLNYDKL